MISNPSVATGAKTAIKTADQTVSNSNVLQNDNDLKLDVGANEIWDVFVSLKFNSDATAVLRVGFTVPAGGSFHWVTHGEIGALTGGSPIATDTTLHVWSTDGTDQYGMAWIRYVGGANAGTLQLQWCQSTPQVLDTKMLIGSWLIAHKVSA